MRKKQLKIENAHADDAKKRKKLKLHRGERSSSKSQQEPYVFKSSTFVQARRSD